jgi:hypothetical protein
MKPANTILFAALFTMALLALPVQAHADWMENGMHPGAVVSPNQGQTMHHEVHINVAPPVRIKPQNRVQPPKPIEVRTSPIVNHDRAAERHDTNPGYFRRDINYYEHPAVVLPYADVDSGFVVPDGYETIMVNGETFYYDQGIFYSQVGDQLTAIPPVLGAVVDYIPQDYQIIMVDGAHYLFTGGVYYQRVDQGFEVAQPPVSDQE